MEYTGESEIYNRTFLRIGGRRMLMRRRKRAKNNELIAKANVLEAELIALKVKLNENCKAKGDRCSGMGDTTEMDMAKEIIKKCFE